MCSIIAGVGGGCKMFGPFSRYVPGRGRSAGRQVGAAGGGRGCGEHGEKRARADEERSNRSGGGGSGGGHESGAEGELPGRGHARTSPTGVVLRECPMAAACSRPVTVGGFRACVGRAG